MGENRVAQSAARSDTLPSQPTPDNRWCRGLDRDEATDVWLSLAPVTRERDRSTLLPTDAPLSAPTFWHHHQIALSANRLKLRERLIYQVGMWVICIHLLRVQLAGLGNVMRRERRSCSHRGSVVASPIIQTKLPPRPHVYLKAQHPPLSSHEFMTGPDCSGLRRISQS
jgi:hypothetical protein